MEPALPMAPHDLDVFPEDVGVAFDHDGDVAALAVVFHGDGDHPTHVDTYPLPDPTGPVYVALADGTIIRWHPDPPTAADALTVVYAGHGLQGHDVPAVVGDGASVVAGRVVVRGQLLRPSVLLPESPATPHAFRHRAHRLRTCRAVRWWPGLADEYQALLPDGWQLSQEGDVRWAVVNTDGDYVDLTGTDYLLMEDGTTSVVTGSQRSLFALWQQITGPDAAPAPPPPPPTSPDPVGDDVTSTAAAAGITTDDTP